MNTTELIDDNGEKYEPTDTSEAEGLWSNGKFIEGEFNANATFSPSRIKVLGGCLVQEEWEPLGAIPVKKVVPKKDPLVWTGKASVGAIGGAVVYLPREFRNKPVEVREITEPEPEPAPELDLSPLTEEEFRQLQIGDQVGLDSADDFEFTIGAVTATAQGTRHVWHGDVGYGYSGGDWIPFPETARRMRGGK